MRPTAQRQSTLRMPLNEILGTEANVRVLRVLAERRTPMSAAEVARQAQLQPSTVHRSIKTLEDSGILEFFGATSQPLLALRSQGPLAQAIRDLFTAETARYQALVDGLKRIVANISPPPLSIWLTDRIANQKHASAAVPVFVLDGAQHVDASTERLRRDVEPLEKTLDIPIEVRGRTVPDLQAMPAAAREDLANPVLLGGIPPEAALDRYREHVGGRAIRSHADLDKRARQLGAEIADAIKTDPSLVRDALAYIERRWPTASNGERKELVEWRQILRTQSPTRIRKLLVDPGERATRLRQTLPFLDAIKRPLSRPASRRTRKATR